jgi:hypothetical protein
MKCDLCSRDLATEHILCPTCADAIRRLVQITKAPAEPELARRAAAAGKGTRS